MKLLLLNTIYSIFLLMMTFSVRAEGGGAVAGGGGSYSEADLYGEQENYTQVVSKIRNFFEQHGQELKSVFPEFEVKQFLDTAKNVRLDVVDRELTDDDGVRGRTCLNYKGNNFIECDINKLKFINKNPKAQFVLMMHELFGLIGVEETTPLNPKIIDGYKVSKKIAPYVEKVTQYDLVFKKRRFFDNYKRKNVNNAISIEGHSTLYNRTCNVAKLEFWTANRDRKMFYYAKNILERKGYNFLIIDNEYLRMAASSLKYEDFVLDKGMTIILGTRLVEWRRFSPVNYLSDTPDYVSPMRYVKLDYQANVLNISEKMLFGIWPFRTTEVNLRNSEETLKVDWNNIKWALDKIPSCSARVNN